jgi:hypothetical protein
MTMVEKDPLIRALAEEASRKIKEVSTARDDELRAIYQEYQSKVALIKREGPAGDAQITSEAPQTVQKRSNFTNPSGTHQL